MHPNKPKKPFLDSNKHVGAEYYFADLVDVVRGLSSKIRTLDGGANGVIFIRTLEFRFIKEVKELSGFTRRISSTANKASNKAIDISFEYFSDSKRCTKVVVSCVISGLDLERIDEARELLISGD